MHSRIRIRIMPSAEKVAIIRPISRILRTIAIFLPSLVAAPVQPATADTQASPPVRFAGTPWEQAAHREGIAPALLYALALTRSGKTEKDGTAAPWPWTLIIGGTPRHYASRAQAEAALARLDRHTAVGIGLVGIPMGLSRRGTTASDPWDPAANLRLAAAALAERLRATPQDTALAVGHFAHPNDRAAARTLGRRVLAIAAALDDVGQTRRAVAIRKVAGTGSEAAHAAPVARLIRAAARRHGVDPAFALAIAHAESGFRQRAVSPKGARGVMQLMPGTAARYGADPRDLAQNVEAGVRYLRDLAELFDGDPALVAAGYNAGEGAVLRHGRRVPPFPETRRYVPRVLAARERYR
jgi:soluble lytic murein transglycosylase-like protein